MTNLARQWNQTRVILNFHFPTRIIFKSSRIIQTNKIPIQFMKWNSLLIFHFSLESNTVFQIDGCRGKERDNYMQDDRLSLSDSFICSRREELEREQMWTSTVREKKNSVLCWFLTTIVTPKSECKITVWRWAHPRSLPFPLKRCFPPPFWSTA